jgi:hypothetical protein
MKRLLLPALTLTFAAASPSARIGAQVIPFVGGGVASGVGDLSHDTSGGWLGFAGFDVPLGSSSGLTIGASGSYAHIPYQGSFGEATNVTGIFGEFGYLYGAGSSLTVKPYLRAGVGVLLQNYAPGTSGYRSQSDALLGFSGGAGLAFALKTATPFLGAHYTAGSNAGFFAIDGGIAFPLGGTRAPPPK